MQIWASWLPFRFEILLMALFALFGCSSVKCVPIETDVKVVYRDSIVWRYDTVMVEIPTERVVMIVPEIDTLVMETTYASARAWLDTAARQLKGQMEQQGNIAKAMEIPEHVIYKDSIIIRQVPVKVEVEKAITPK